MPERRFTDNKPGSISTYERKEGEPPVIVGYASVFYDGTEATEFQLWDRAVERIMPGTFDRAISEGDDVRSLFNHDPSLLLGRTPKTLTLSVDDRGLQYNNALPTTSTGRDVEESIRRGDLRGSSFSFQVTDQEWRTENEIDIREVRGVRLFDVGPVTFPAYEASTTGVRGFVSDARSSWEEWQEAMKEVRDGAIASKNQRRACRARSISVSS